MVALSAVALQLAYERDIAAGSIKQLLLRVENGHHWFESKWEGKGTNTTHTAVTIVVGFALLLVVPIIRRFIGHTVSPQEAQMMVREAMENGAAALMKLMAEEADDRNVVLEACSILLDEAFLSEQKQQEYGAAGLCPCVLAALVRFPLDVSVLSSGVTLMGRLSKQEQNAQDFGRAGCEVAISALRRFPNHEVIGMGGVDAMINLGSGHASNLLHLHELGALEVVEAAKSKWPELVSPAGQLLHMVSAAAETAEGSAKESKPKPQDQ
jgi:hypothetical protein